jgi:formate dehydrogenase subunit delta
MNIAPLVTMANQIGEFFDAMPDRPEALDGLTQHIRLFWTPKMRRAFTDHFEQTGGAGLTPIVIDALRKRSILPTAVPAGPTSPDEPPRDHAWEGDTES